MIKTIEDLERVLKVLRSQGVDLFKMDGIEMSLGQMPYKEEGKPLDQVTDAPSEAELDRAVGLPPMGLDDPFLHYNESSINEDQ